MFTVQDLVVVLEVLVKRCLLAESVGGSGLGAFLPDVVAFVIKIGHAPKELARMTVRDLESLAAEFGHLDGHVKVGLAHVPLRCFAYLHAIFSWNLPFYRI